MTVDLDSIQADIPVAATIRRRARRDFGRKPRAWGDDRDRAAIGRRRARRDLARRPASRPPAQYP
jgi:hypothetical protein